MNYYFKYLVLIFFFLFGTSLLRAETTEKVTKTVTLIRETPSSSPTPLAAPSITPSPKPSISLTAPEIPVSQKEFKLIWEIKGLKKPESVVFDSLKGLFYVSNMNGAPNEKNGLGFISKIDLNGKLVELEWVKGLNAPKGMALYRNYLYVADIDQLIQIDIETGEKSQIYYPQNAQFLNDIAVDQKGLVYITDMLTNTIYRLEDGYVSVWFQDPRLESPNGILVEVDRIVIASWGKPNPDFSTDVPGRLMAVMFEDKRVEILGTGVPVGNLDGIASDQRGHYFVSDWILGTIFEYDWTGHQKPVLVLEQGTADLMYMATDKRLIIPLMNAGKLVCYEDKRR